MSKRITEGEYRENVNPTPPRDSQGGVRRYTVIEVEYHFTTQYIYLQSGLNWYEPSASFCILPQNIKILWKNQCLKFYSLLMYFLSLL